MTLKIIGGVFKGRVLASPSLKNKSPEMLRPSLGRVRQVVFDHLQTLIEGANFLDLFAGSGALGLEALSRGACFVTFLEKNRASLALLKKNIASLNHSSSKFSPETFSCLERSEVLQGDVFQILESWALKGPSWDIIYADPPYDGEIFREGKKISYGNRVLELVDQGNFLKKEGVLWIEDKDMQEDPLLDSLKLKRKKKVGIATLREYKKM